MPSEEDVMSPMDAIAAGLDERLRLQQEREGERRARRDARHPFPPGVYLVVAVGLSAAILLTGFPALVDVIGALVVVLSLVSFYRAGERFMEQVAQKNNAPKSEYWNARRT